MFVHPCPACKLFVQQLEKAQARQLKRRAASIYILSFDKEQVACPGCCTAKRDNADRAGETEREKEAERETERERGTET